MMVTATSISTSTTSSIESFYNLILELKYSSFIDSDEIFILKIEKFCKQYSSSERGILFYVLAIETDLFQPLFFLLNQDITITFDQYMELISREDCDFGDLYRYVTIQD